MYVQSKRGLDVKQRVYQPGGLIAFRGSGTLDRHSAVAFPHRRCDRARRGNRRPGGIDDAIRGQARLCKYIEIHLAPRGRGAKFPGGAIKGTIDF